MATTTFVGTAVDFVAGGAVYELNGISWSLNLTAELVDISDGWDSVAAWRKFDAGWLSGSGTIEAKVDSAVPLIAPGATITGAIFTMSAGTTITLDIVITGYTVNAERNGPVTVSWEFTVTGETTPVFAP